MGTSANFDVCIRKRINVVTSRFTIDLFKMVMLYNIYYHTHKSSENIIYIVQGPELQCFLKVKEDIS